MCAVFDVSSLLQVGDALLDVIFDPDVADGAGLVIDGFPRTALQVTQLIPCTNTQILLLLIAHIET